MGEHQRCAEVARHNAIAKAQRRFDGQLQRAQATFNRTMTRARQERDVAIEKANCAYRDAENADPLNQGTV